MNRLQSVTALALVLAQGCAAQRPAWLGTYRPISAVCAGQTLTVNTGVFSYSDCKNVKFKILSDQTSGFSFEVAADAKCLLPGWVLSLKPSSSDVELNGYRSSQDKVADIPAFTCTYTKPTPTSAPKNR